MSTKNYNDIIGNRPPDLPAFSALLQVKAIPLQAWTGPEVSRVLRVPGFKVIST